MQPQNQNQYDFIMQSGNSGPSGPAILQNNNPQKQMILIVAFIGVIITLLVIAFAVFSSLTKPKVEDLVDVSAQQTELLRVTELGLEQARSGSVRGQLETLQSFITSDHAATTTLLSSNGFVVPELELIKYLDADVEKDIESAVQRNTLDADIIEIVDDRIDAYKKSLNTALTNDGSESKKAVLTTAAENILTYEAP